MCLTGTGLPRCLQLSFCGSLCSLFLARWRTHSGGDKSMQAGVSQRFCVHAYHGRSRSSQMLVGLFLLFSELCFSFTDPGRKEIRELIYCGTIVEIKFLFLLVYIYLQGGFIVIFPHMPIDKIHFLYYSFYSSILYKQF
jgi:hypothetical protein